MHVKFDYVLGETGYNVKTCTICQHRSLHLSYDDLVLHQVYCVRQKVVTQKVLVLCLLYDVYTGVLTKRMKRRREASFMS